MTKRIGILTAGGDCPGLNAAIRGVAKTAIVEYGMEVLGFHDGYKGLIDNDYTVLTESSVSGILTQGGTILGTSREKPFKQEGSGELKTEKIVENYKELELDCLVCIGGNGTIKTAHKLSKLDLNVIAIPKTIDNDVWGTDLTFGFDSAVSICTDAIDRLHTTGNSHKRIMIIEVMGHNAGWIALYSGIAGGGDVILLPEIECNIDIIAKYLHKRHTQGKPVSIVVIAEGIYEKSKEKLDAYQFAQKIEELTGIETRSTVLGYIQRGGTPTAADRILATRYGRYAAHLIAKEKYNQLVVFKNNTVSHIPLKESAGKLKTIEPNEQIVTAARELGVCFGDKIN
ncbi:MAG: 6-phosphofructokinase [Bacteroidales bacterium]|jgi:6-phosphofructokinase 1|nr:6-phosphofructokinase [Bacteroidales bacterium]